MIELRDYQHEMLGRLESAWEKHRSVMVQMPTGTGKTVLLAEVIKRHTDGTGGTDFWGRYAQSSLRFL